MQRVAFTVRLPEELHRSIRVYAAGNNLDLQTVMERAAAVFLQGGGGHRPASCPLAGASVEETAAVVDFLHLWRGAPCEVRLYILALLKAGPVG